MKLAAVVVLYNPEEIGIGNIAKNIGTYSKQCGHIYVVDNSPVKTILPLSDITYIHNKNCGGIGGGRMPA